MANPIGYAGRGTQVQFTQVPVTGGSVYTPLTQLSKFSKTGAKLKMDDITCLDSPGDVEFPSPVSLSNGSYDFEGVYNPQDASIQAMQTAFAAMAQLGYKIILVDGTVFTGLCYVEVNTPTVDVYKNNRYSGKMNIFGLETVTPQGGAPIQE